MQGGLVETATFTSSKIGGGDGEDLETGLSGMQGVRGVVVDGESHTVQVSYDPTIVDENRVRSAVEDLGYPVGDITASDTRDVDPTGYADDALLT